MSRVPKLAVNRWLLLTIMRVSTSGIDQRGVFRHSEEMFDLLLSRNVTFEKPACLFGYALISCHS